MLTAEVLELTRPMYSSMIFGVFPAALICVGDGINVGIAFLVLSCCHPNGKVYLKQASV
jgi:hypothetical protein